MFPIHANEIENCELLPNQNVTFTPETIFDEQEKDILFFHRWANWLHITTKIVTLENESAFFLTKCNKTSEDLAELERHLRNKGFLRDAKVTSDADLDNIDVKTWDNWSLMPTISFGRKGGVNSYSFGIKERNLLGLGIETEIESYSNSQRSGYKIDSTIPLFQKQNIELYLKFADNDDGTQKSLFIEKFFAGFHTSYAYDLGFNVEEKEDTLFQNGEDQSIFVHKINYEQASYSWLEYNTAASVFRYKAGITYDQHIFSQVTEPVNTLPVNELPHDREFFTPWLGFEYIQKDFTKLVNIRLISQIEDFNHGWQITSQLGIGDGSKENAAWALLKASIKKGFVINNDALLLLDLSLAADSYQDQSDRILASIDTEFFYRLTDNWGLYLNNVNTFSENQYIDRPITMGGDTGLRGFPLQYQHGKNSIKFTSELRYYPQLNLFKIVDVAGAVFFDNGRAFGGSIEENIETSWLSSAGVGIRLYSPHSAGKNHIIHIDFAFPFSDNPDIDNFEIRVQAKHSF